MVTETKDVSDYSFGLLSLVGSALLGVVFSVSHQRNALFGFISAGPTSSQECLFGLFVGSNVGAGYAKEKFVRMELCAQTSDAGKWRFSFFLVMFLTKFLSALWPSPECWIFA